MPSKLVTLGTSSTVTTSQPNDEGNTPVSEAAPQVSDDDGGGGKTLIAPIQAKGSHPPLFAIVVQGMDTRHLLPLSAYLGDDQPFYRIQASGPRVRECPHSAAEFEGLAEEYVHAMKTVQPTGPYYLYGMCEGARIAFDMARRLECQGEGVGLLAIIDTWVLENVLIKTLWKINYYRDRLKQLWRLPLAEKGNRCREILRHRLARFQPRDRAVRAKATNTSPTKASPTISWSEVYWPGKTFVPARFGGKITVFKRRQQPYFYVKDRFLGWGSRTTAEVELQVIDPFPRKHTRLFREPYVRQLGTDLAGCLERARNARGLPDCETKKASLPDFFIIGAPRCGTTALYEYLKCHPQIFMSSIKEPSYFCDDFSPRWRKCTDEVTYLKRFFRGVGKEHTMVGEASAMYLYSTTAVKNIRSSNPNAKIIVMLREPVEMLHSLHSRHLYDFYIEKEDFRESWNLQAARSRGENRSSLCLEPAFLQYREVASFGKQLQRVYACFPRPQVKVIFYEDFKNNPDTAYADVLSFLGIDHDGRKHFPVVNANQHHRVYWLGKLLHVKPDGLTRTANAVKRALGLKTLGVGRVARKLDAVGGQRESMPQSTRQEVALALRSDIELLEKLTGRDLSHWKHHGESAPTDA